MTFPRRTTDPPVCDCCQRRVLERTAKAMLGSMDMLCTDCWHAWYDGEGSNPEGGQDPGMIKAAVLKKHGLYGGAANLTAPLLRFYDQQGALTAAAQAVVAAYAAIHSGATIDAFADAVHALAAVLAQGDNDAERDD